MTTETLTTTAAASVVTPERYHTGIGSFLGWMNAIENNKHHFRKHHEAYEPALEDQRFFRKAVLEHGVKALVIGEDWCPDVWRGLPVVARLSETTAMEVRYFFRDQNKDIMSEFLKDGEFESIPTVVFYDGDHNYLGHWIERAKEADAGLAELRKQIFPEPMPERGSPAWDELQAKYRLSAIDAAAPWRHAQAREMRQIVEAGLRKLGKNA